MTDAIPATTRRRRFLSGLRALDPLVLGVAVALVFLALSGMRAVFARGAYTFIQEGVLLSSARDASSEFGCQRHDGTISVSAACHGQSRLRVGDGSVGGREWP